MNHHEEMNSIIAELESIAERMTDLSMSILSNAIETGATSRPAEEKRVSQARRAVEKALQHLRAV
jgi:DNA-binding ferritin-like protein